MFDMTALELSAAIKEKKFSVSEVVSAYIDAIEKKDKQLNAFITVSKEKALLRAKEIQSLIESGDSISPLAGVPIALKDNISTMGIETTCASKMLQGYTPVFNATVVEKLESAGMIVIGKTNMDEFAMGVSGETSIFSAALNPWDVSHVSGGSSGGSAAAAAADLAPLSLGSDTGGSIRLPCSFCGVTGIKPSYGAVSRHGLVAHASSLDQIGPIGRNINDCAALLSIISGQDGRDGTCVIEKPFKFDTAFHEKLDGVKIGIPRNYFDSVTYEDVKHAVLAAADEFKAAGASLEEFEMPFMDNALSVYNIISCAEASSNLSKFDGLKYGYRSADAKTLSEVYRLSRSEGFGFDVKKKIMFGSFVLSSEYYNSYFKKALQARALIKDAYNKLFERFDIILSPVTPVKAFLLGEYKSDPEKTRKADVFTAPVNLAGLPAVSLPCGFDKQGLPIGFQLIGKAFYDDKLVETARLYQNRTDHHTKTGSAS